VNVLSQSRANIFLPYVFGPLSKNAQGHWNQTVEGLAQSVLKMVRTARTVLHVFSVKYSKLDRHCSEVCCLILGCDNKLTEWPTHV
jgi:hypothetical protein